MNTPKTKPSLVIHVCCAICGAYLCELLKEKFNLIIFFYNPNIHPRDEYEKRKDSAKKLSEIYGAEFVEGEYETDKWFETVKGLEGEPEGGKRCPICFQMRLYKTALLANNKNAEYFTTTLSASPYKNEQIVNEIGQDIAKELNLKFLKISELGDRKEIWKKSRELAKKYNFYHQKYCGCVFSQR